MPWHVVYLQHELPLTRCQSDRSTQYRYGTKLYKLGRDIIPSLLVLMLSLAPLLLLLGSACVYALDYVPPYSRVTIFAPPSSYTVPRTLYARTLLIPQDGDDENVLLATWENYSPEPPLVWFPIYRSNDLGQTWEHISNVTDDVNGWGMRYQPFLYELTEDIGNFPVSSIPSFRPKSKV